MHGSSNFCYVFLTSTNGAVWTNLESDLSKAKASATATPCATDTIYAWIGSQGRAGYACIADGATPVAGTTLYPTQ